MSNGKAIRILQVAYKTLKTHLVVKKPHDQLFNHITVDLIDNNFYSWVVCLYGLPGTTWQGAAYILSVHFPIDFPHSGPVVKFLTPVFHPNVSVDGNFSMAFNDQQPLVNYFRDLLVLLHYPNPLIAINSEAAALFVSDSKSFEQAARDHASRHATDYQRYLLLNILSGAKQNLKEIKSDLSLTSISSNSREKRAFSGTGLSNVSIVAFLFKILVHLDCA